MKTYALYSMKGGVGKTASAVNLSYLSARDGFRTLLCDLDPQGASSFYFRIRAGKNFNTNKFVKGARNIDRNIKGSDYANLDLLPSKLSFRNMDLALNSLKKSKTRLKKIFKSVKHEYDNLFFDCAPGISLISENIFNASDFIIVPVIPTTLSLITYEKLIEFLRKKEIDASRVFIFFSMVEKRKSLHTEIIEEIMSKKQNVLTTHIPYRSDIEKMGIHRAPVHEFEPSSDGARAFEDLWEEIRSL